MQVDKEKANALETIFASNKEFTTSFIHNVLESNGNKFDEAVDALLEMSEKNKEETRGEDQGVNEEALRSKEERENIQRIQSMFAGDLTDSIVCTVFRSNKGAIEETVDTLLNMTSAEMNPHHVSNEERLKNQRENERKMQEEEIRKHEEYKRLQMLMQQEERKAIEESQRVAVEEMRKEKERLAKLTADHQRVIIQQEMMLKEHEARKRAQEEEAKRLEAKKEEALQMERKRLELEARRREEEARRREEEARRREEEAILKERKRLELEEARRIELDRKRKELEAKKKQEAEIDAKRKMEAEASARKRKEMEDARKKQEAEVAAKALLEEKKKKEEAIKLEEERLAKEREERFIADEKMKLEALMKKIEEEKRLVEEEKMREVAERQRIENVLKLEQERMMKSWEEKMKLLSDKESDLRAQMEEERRTSMLAQERKDRERREKSLAEEEERRKALMLEERRLEEIRLKEEEKRRFLMEKLLVEQAEEKKRIEEERRKIEEERRNKEKELMKKEKQKMKALEEQKKLLESQKRQIEEEKKRIEEQKKIEEELRRLAEEEQRRIEEEKIKALREEEERRMMEEQRMREEEEEKRRMMEEEEEKRRKEEEEKMRREEEEKNTRPFIDDQDENGNPLSTSAVFIPDGNKEGTYVVSATVEEDKVTCSWTLDNGFATSNWVGLYDANQDETYLKAAYTKGEAAGELSFKKVLPGHYELRFFASRNSQQPLARSEVVRVGPSASISTQLQGEHLLVHYAFDPLSTTPTADWLGVYEKTQKRNKNYLTMSYGNREGRVILKAPRKPGVYEVRLFVNGGYNDQVRTEFVVEDHDCVVVEPNVVKAAESGNVTWVLRTVEPSTGDWIGVYKAEETNNKNYLACVYTNGSSVGASTFVAPKEAGVYELRMFSRSIGKYVTFRTSGPFTVV